MEIETQTSGGEAHLAWSGELTLASAQQLRTDLLQRLERGGLVVLDLQQVTEIDLACVQVLAAAQRSWSARGRPLQILWSRSVGQAWNEAGYPRGE